MGEEAIRILLIEDNLGDARLIQELLSEINGFSFTFVHADRLSVGLEYLSNDDLDVVVLDLSLPDSSGYETFNQLHSRSPILPIVLLTGLEDELLGAKAVREGAQDYLVKNHLDGNLLSRAIRYAIERKRSEEALRESEERYMLATQGANDGLWDWDFRKDVIYYSPRWKEMVGCQNSEIGHSPEDWFSRVHPQDVQLVKVALATHLKGIIPHFESEYRIQHCDGSYRWMLARGLAVRDENNVAYRMAGSQTDITARKNAEEQLTHDAFHDSLTGLPNRALFLDRLERTLEHTKRRTDYLYAVLFLDLDRFKIINDSLGHVIGDQLLVRIAQLLQKCLRSGDTVARLGGDEFVILLEDIKDRDDVITIASRIQEMLVLPFVVEGHKVYTSSSMGIVLSTVGYSTSEDILRDADIAMYQAKLLGKARYVVFEKEMRNQAFARLELESDLRHAFERRELKLHYQPIVSLINGRVIGFEALLRWTHPEKGEIPPKIFIPVAEETGLIFGIGKWVLREACQQLFHWQKMYPFNPPLSMSVNISCRQFDQPDLADQIFQILQETNLSPNSLNLELTENMLLGNSDEVNVVLERLRQVGVMIHIDDFGTGYSSFGYLQRYPINTLKIDQSFVSHMGSDGDNGEIVKTILLLARELGMQAIAEGVETQSQLEQLVVMNCSYGQGYFLYRPTSPENAGVLLKMQFDLGLDGAFVRSGIQSNLDMFTPGREAELL